MNQQGLPGRWARNRWIAAVLTFLFVAAVMYIMRDNGRADRLDSWWLRARFSLRETVQGNRVDPQIVLVEIDDRSVTQWKEPLVFWGPRLASALDRISRGGAKLIALDWLQPVSTEKWFPGHDARLAQSLAGAPNVVLAKIAAEGKGGWISTTPELLFALPDSALDPDAHLGFADLGGRDSVVAAVVPSVAQNGYRELSFASRIVQRLGKKPVKIPLRKDGSLLIRYAPGSGRTGKNAAFQRYSLYDIAQPTAQPDMRFKDKIVLIGATYSGLNDTHYIPFLDGLGRARVASGVEVQANSLRTLLDARPITEPDANGLWWLALLPVALVVLSFVRLPALGATAVTLLVIAGWIALSFGMFQMYDRALPITLPLFGALLGAGVMGGYRTLSEERERQQVLSLWGRYQDPRLVDYLLQHPEARGGDGREMTATVLFADLKNFTKTVEDLEPGEALRVLNRYLSLMTTVIRDEYGGVVDKYLGDGLLAQWGAPQLWDESGVQNHAEAAIRACLELERRVRELAASSGTKTVNFGLRLSLHSGPVVVGWVGAERIEFTVIGDTVNVSSRLQETAKELGCEFLISESTYELARFPVKTGQEAEVEIRGRHKPLRVYEVLGEETGAE
ncbi:MAG TPA: adenylate/guanylate cyclase domain-containing protein, partial [Abditibacteriaceae bacterium]